MAPSPFAIEFAPALSREFSGQPRALDLAMGRGRHALLLAGAGFRVFGVDRKFDAVAEAAQHARTMGLSLRSWCADLTTFPLPKARFELVLVTRYLQRDLFRSIADAVVPGGFVMYETFTTRQRALGTGPKSADHLLEPGELRRAFDGFEIRVYEETVSASEAVARLIARRRS